MDTSTIERRTLTIAEVCGALGISRALATKAIREGKIPGGFQLGDRWLVSKEGVERLLSGKAQEQK